MKNIKLNFMVDPEMAENIHKLVELTGAKNLSSFMRKTFKTMIKNAREKGHL